jgi:hypothetical protein
MGGAGKVNLAAGAGLALASFLTAAARARAAGRVIAGGVAELYADPRSAASRAVPGRAADRRTTGT